MHVRNTPYLYVVPVQVAVVVILLKLFVMQQSSNLRPVPLPQQTLDLVPVPGTLATYRFFALCINERWVLMYTTSYHTGSLR